MTQLDFYVLQDVERNAMLRFACRLAVKAARTGRPIYVHAASAEQAREFGEPTKPCGMMRSGADRQCIGVGGGRAGRWPADQP